MCQKWLVNIVVIVAVILAMVASLGQPAYVDIMIGISRFFDIMLPILASGALIKYLYCRPRCVYCEARKPSCEKSQASSEGQVDQ